MGKLVLRKTILRNMIDRVWAAKENEDGGSTFLRNIGNDLPDENLISPQNQFDLRL
jgi:hypothetical protein